MYTRFERKGDARANKHELTERNNSFKNKESKRTADIRVNYSDSFTHEIFNVYDAHLLLRRRYRFHLSLSSPLAHLSIPFSHLACV